MFFHFFHPVFPIFPKMEFRPEKLVAFNGTPTHKFLNNFS